MKYHVYESRSGSHWRAWERRRHLRRPVRDFLLLPFRIATMPLAFLTILLVHVLVPFMKFRDRKRNQ